MDRSRIIFGQLDYFCTWAQLFPRRLRANLGRKLKHEREFDIEPFAATPSAVSRWCVYCVRR
jgi:hypothetical protein